MKTQLKDQSNLKDKFNKLRQSRIRRLNDSFIHLNYHILDYHRISIQSYRIIFYMQTVLSLPHLLSCLSEKDQYKGTQVYLNEVQRYNQSIYCVIDQAFTKTLIEPKAAPMTKLLSLRFFKEILMTANFSLIDQIDQRIEDQVKLIALYNKKSKEVSRGANYFIEMSKLKNGAQTQKIGSSYVLLALEIILVFGKWCKIDQDGQQTRFHQYYNELCATGVIFPPENHLNFFKKDDEEKFKRNYKKWNQHLIQIANATKKTNEAIANIAQSKPIVQKNVSFPSEIEDQQKKKNKENIKKQVQKPTTLNVYPENNYAFTSQIVELKKQLAQKDQMINQLKQQLVKQQGKFAGLEKEINNQKIQLLKVQEQLRITKQSKDKLSQQAGQSQYYQILVSPPKNTDDLISQIDMLQDLMQQTTQGFQKQKDQIVKQLSELKIQNKGLKQTIQLREQQINKLREQKKEEKLMQEQQLIENRVFRQSQAGSLHVTDEPKIGSKQMQEKQLLIIKEQIITTRKQVLKDFTNTNKKLRQQLSQVCQNKVDNYKNSRQGSRSLKKTESQHRLMMNQTSMTAANFKRNNNNQSKLTKTAQTFKTNQNNKLVTIFPFLDDYFPKLPIQCRNFKQHCITQLNEPFYQNQYLKVGLAKQKQGQNYFIYIYNKTSVEQKIKLLANQSSIQIEGEKVKKVPALTAGQFKLKIGVPDINMRFPTVTIQVGNHGISLTNSSNQKIFTVPLPITLIDYFKIKKYSSYSMPSKTIRFGVSRFLMSSTLPNIQQILPNISSQIKFGQTVRIGLIQCQRSPIKLQISQWNREMSLHVQFSDRCEKSSALSKVIIQVLMWLLRD